MQVKARATTGPGRIADADLRLLRVFKSVAESGGMAAAELELGLAISTISRHVKDLEERLGLVLCRRGRSGFALTPEGERVHAAAVALLRATDSFRAELHDIRARMAGDLHVALFEKLASHPQARLPQAIAAFCARAPEVKVNLHVGTIASIERGVLDGRFHLGVIPEHRPSASLAYDPLFHETMQLYAAPSHPWFSGPDTGRSWQALRSQSLAGLDYHSPNQRLAHARGLGRSAVATDQEGVLLLVLSGLHLGFLPDHYASRLVEARALRAVAPKALRYRCRYACIRRRDPAPPRVAGEFRDALLAAVSQG